MAQGPGFTVNGLTPGTVYTALIPVWSEQNAPDVAVLVDGVGSGPIVTAKGTAAARYTFTATGVSHTIRLEPQPIVSGVVYGDTWAGGWLLVEGVYAGAYFGEELYEQPPVVLYDHEARQGEATDYLLADPDGAQVAAVTVSVPLWGTWLKSPGRPYLNTRCHLNGVGTVGRQARRQRVAIDGASREVVLSQRRAGRAGGLRVATLTDAAAAAVERLLDDGLTIMLDTPPDWRIPYRYVSVGDSEEVRPMGDELGLDRPSRVFALADVVEVDPPLGVTVVDRGRTYATLPTLFGSYAAMAATNEAYDVLAVGA